MSFILLLLHKKETLFNSLLVKRVITFHVF